MIKILLPQLEYPQSRITQKKYFFVFPIFQEFFDISAKNATFRFIAYFYLEHFETNEFNLLEDKYFTKNHMDK